MTAEIIYKGDLRTQAKHLKSGETIITDAPTDNQGKGEAFSPTDLLATSLGCCAITVMGIAARNHNIDIDGTKVEVLKTMGTDPRRVIAIDIKFTFPKNNYTAKEKKLLEHTAHTCPVAKSLHPDLIQNLVFDWNE